MGTVLELFVDVYLQVGFSVTMSFAIWRLAIYEKSSQVGELQISGWKNWLIALLVSVAVSAIVKLAYDEECIWGSVTAAFAPIGVMLVLFGDHSASSIVLEIVLGAIMKWLMEKMFRVGVIVFSIASVILVLSDIKTTVIRNHVKQDGVAENITVVHNKIFSSNARVLEKMKRENWCKASLAEREQACYELMQLYMLFFNGTIDEETRLMAGNDFRDEIVGFYRYDKNFILIDRQYMADDERYEDCLNCVTYETYHWFEFKDYVSAEIDREAYHKQLCEIDANDFADRVTPQLLKLIERI